MTSGELTGLVIALIAECASYASYPNHGNIWLLIGLVAVTLALAWFFSVLDRRRRG